MPELASASIGLPSHAHVPGRNARHPEGAFDALKAGAADAGIEELHFTDAFRAGLSWLEAGYFWECHEVLEAVWMRTPDPSPEREMVQALIQLANARLKLRMERPKAARRLCEITAGHLGRCPTGKVILGLRSQDVQNLLAETERYVNMHYVAVNTRDNA